MCSVLGRPNEPHRVILKMHILLMIRPVPSRSKALLTIPTRESFNFLMNSADVSLQLAVGTEPFVTRVTWVGSDVEVNSVKVAL